MKNIRFFFICIVIVHVVMPVHGASKKDMKFAKKNAQKQEQASLNAEYEITKAVPYFQRYKVYSLAC